MVRAPEQVETCSQCGQLTLKFKSIIFNFILIWRNLRFWSFVNQLGMLNKQSFVFEWLMAEITCKIVRWIHLNVSIFMAIKGPLGLEPFPTFPTHIMIGFSLQMFVEYVKPYRSFCFADVFTNITAQHRRRINFCMLDSLMCC